MLDHEIRVDEIERPVVEGKPFAQIGDDEPVEGAVLDASFRIEVDACQLGDAMAVCGEPRRPSTARVEHMRVGAECRVEKPASTSTCDVSNPRMS